MSHAGIRLYPALPPLFSHDRSIPRPHGVHRAMTARAGVAVNVLADSFQAAQACAVDCQVRSISWRRHLRPRTPPQTEALIFSFSRFLVPGWRLSGAGHCSRRRMLCPGGYRRLWALRERARRVQLVGNTSTTARQAESFQACPDAIQAARTGRSVMLFKFASRGRALSPAT